MTLAIFSLEFVEKINQGNFSAIARFLDKSAKDRDPISIRENALHIVNILLKKDFNNHILNWLFNRLNYKLGRYYFQGKQVFGWIEKHQVQAKQLPLRKESDRLIVTWEKCSPYEWECFGFHEAEKLPVRYFKRQCKVERDVIHAGYQIAQCIGEYDSDRILIRAKNYTLVLKNDKRKGYAVAYPLNLKWKWD